MYFRAQSGTGKTATFSIAVLQSLDISLRETQALILSPTRELAVQIQKVSEFVIQFDNIEDVDETGASCSSLGFCRLYLLWAST